jgi:hypothetical protein
VVLGAVRPGVVPGSPLMAQNDMIRRYFREVGRRLSDLGGRVVPRIVTAACLSCIEKHNLGNNHENIGMV